MKRVASTTLSLLLAPSIALAQNEPAADAVVERTGLEFKAPDTCPNVQEFKAKVQERAEGDEFVESEATRTFVVKIEKRGATFHGSFRIRGGGTTKRKVSSASCTEVSDALAVVAALSLAPLNEDENGPGTPTFVTTYGEADSSKAVAEESKLVAVEDDPQVDAKTDESSQKRNEEAAARQLTQKRKLKKGHTIAVDVQAGATLGRYPESAASRFDLSLRTGALLQISENAEYLWGFVPRLRGNFQPLSRIRLADYHVHVNGAGFAAGGCYTPYYDPNGFRVFGCFDFGASHMVVEPLYVPPSEDTMGGAVLLPQYWTGVATLSLESEFKMISIFYAALRMGLQQETRGSEVVYDPYNGNSILTISGTTFIASGGIGAHF